jgi:hypothetical protein
MKITNELFLKYINTPSEKKRIELSRELGIECVSDMEESFYIWAVNHGEKNTVMDFYQMNEKEYAEAKELWADEAETQEAAA